LGVRGSLDKPGRQALIARSRVHESERNINEAWEDFLAGRPLPVSPDIRTEVMHSWRRSCQAGVNPGARGGPVAFAGEQLCQLQSLNWRLMEAAGPIMERAADLLSDANSMMILTDANGVILKAVGDPRTIEAGREIHLEVGANWNEKAAGTNGIGIALALKRPVFVHATEHFCEPVKDWTCSGAPIRDPVDGSVIGLLDVSGPKRISERHNLAISVMAAQRIEASLEEQSTSERLRLMEACLTMPPSSTEDGILALDRTGRVVHQNDKIGELLRRWSVPAQPTVGQTFIDAVESSDPEEWRNRLPRGLSPDWLLPLRVDGESIGALLIIPNRSRSTKAQPQPRAAEGTSAATTPKVEMIGESESLLSARQKAELAGRGRTPILIQGETGVGKELFARLIHANGKRRQDEPFVTVNCGALSKELLLSELFGYVRGAFTGASDEGRAGHFEAADGGTLCLDEVGEMPLEMQPYLLRVLEEGVVHRLGENRPRKVDIRLVAMTNRDLKQEVAEGRFRRDLYYRIAAATISAPPLRERGPDIDLLTDHFNANFAERYGLAPLEFPEPVREAMRAYSWPGNVRELRNLVENLMLMAPDRCLRLQDLPEDILYGESGQPAFPARPGGEVNGTAPAPTALPPVTTEEPCQLEDAERRTIISALDAYQGNISMAAKRLGISRTTLYRKLKHYGLNRSVKY
jgi:transcriptional regulator of acetoin/glycerol metabolism